MSNESVLNDLEGRLTTLLKSLDSCLDLAKACQDTLVRGTGTERDARPDPVGIMPTLAAAEEIAQDLRNRLGTLVATPPEPVAPSTKV